MITSFNSQLVMNYYTFISTKLYQVFNLSYATSRYLVIRKMCRHPVISHESKCLHWINNISSRTEEKNTNLKDANITDI